MLGGVQSSFGKAPLPDSFFTYNAKILIARRVIIHLIRYHGTRGGGSRKRANVLYRRKFLYFVRKYGKKPR